MALNGLLCADVPLFACVAQKELDALPSDSFAT